MFSHPSTAFVFRGKNGKYYFETEDDEWGFTTKADAIRQAYALGATHFRTPSTANRRIPREYRVTSIWNINRAY